MTKHFDRFVYVAVKIRLLSPGRSLSYVNRLLVWFYCIKGLVNGDTMEEIANMEGEVRQTVEKYGRENKKIAFTEKTFFFSAVSV